MNLSLNHKWIICILIFSIALVNNNMLFGQRLTHRLGELIVEVKDDQSFSRLLKDIQNESARNSPIQFYQLTKEPMNLWVLSVDPNVVNERDVLKEVIFNPNCLQAQFNHIGSYRAEPNDPLFNNQWQYLNIGQQGVAGADINAVPAWDIATGGLTIDGDTIVVCVIDDGIGQNLPDFGDNLWVNHFEIPDNEIDDDGNGYVDDYLGYDAYNGTDNIYQGGGHGTPVAGIVGAQGNNMIGVTGVNWDVKLMIIRGGSPESIALASYSYPYTMRKLYNETNGEKGAFVVSTNASWGVDFGQPEDAPIWCDFYNLLGEEGILNFGATINNNTNVDVAGDLPTACESDYLVAVTNMNSNDRKVTGAGFGQRSIDLGAFGSGTYTTNSSGSYSGFGGTSGATPHVAGTAALLYAIDCPIFMQTVKENPGQAALAVKDFILFGVTPNESLDGITTTGGKLNMYQSALNTLNICDTCSVAYGVAAKSIDTQSAIIEWLDGDQIGDVFFRYKKIEDTLWTELSLESSPYALTDLDFCSTYEFQTKTVCNEDTDTLYSYSKVFKTDGCCTLPDGIGIEKEDNNFLITWSNVTAATSFILEFKNVQTGIVNSITVDGSDGSYLFSGLGDCEFYEMRLKTICANNPDESDLSEVYTINSDCGSCSEPYCSFTPKDSNDEWIGSFGITDVFENVSSNSEGGYSSFLGMFDISLRQVAEYQFVLVPEFSGSTFDEAASIYIDSDFSGTFESNELIYASDQTFSDTLRGTFSLPQSEALGQTRMRVIMRFNQVNGPCDEPTFRYGEIEDYCIEILEAPDCPYVDQPNFVDSTYTTLRFAWPINDIADEYILHYRPSGTDEFIEETSESPEVIIEGLDTCTVYEYRTQLICDGLRMPSTSIYNAQTECMPVSTQDINETEFIQYYPNPVDDYLVLKTGFDQSEIKITDVSGKNVFYDTMQAGQKEISTINWPSGIYVISVSSNNQLYVGKMIKL